MPQIRFRDYDIRGKSINFRKFALTRDHVVGNGTMTHLRQLIAAHLVGAAVLLPASALAQIAPASSTPAPVVEKPMAVEARSNSTSEQSEVIELEKVEVTGSRLRTLGDEVTAIPVFSVSAIELERRGVTRLADIRWAIPQLGASIGFNDNLANAGTSRAQSVGTSFNLRGMGGNSTLVLVDGRRVPHTGQEAPGGAGGREDFNIDGIPVSAIDRIDVLPQGAGAIYGAEAIAGVINVVLKKNYSGAELKLSYDNTFNTDVGQFTGSLTAGHRAGKLSTFLSASWETQNSLAARDRWWTAEGDKRVFGSTSNNFLFNATAGAGSLSTGSSPANGAPIDSQTGLPIWLPGQSSHVVLIPTGSNGSTATNGGATAVTAQNVPLYDSADYSNGIDSAERMSTLFRVNYQVQPNLELYGDVRWSEFKNDTFYTPITLSTSLPIGAPGNPFARAVTLSKVFYDLDRPHVASRFVNTGASLGAKGNFLDTWRYDVNASWSRNVVMDDTLSPTGFNFTALSDALASASAPILAYDSLNGVNPNAPGVLEALLSGTGRHKDTTDVYQYQATADGVVVENWAGSVRAAVGAEAGEEKVKFYRDPAVSYSYLLTDPFARDYTAAFAEASLPLLSSKQSLPLVHLLEVGGAVRYTDYSDAGNVTTPTYRALYQPVKWLTLRASRSEGFKPVRLYDLLAPRTEFTANYTNTTTIRDPLRGNEQVIGTFLYTSGGNPDLESERSVSRNAGIVLDVPGKLFKGLSFSADYYEIKYTDRSGSTGLQVLMNYFPERVTRANPTPEDIAAGYEGRVITWDASNINLAGVWTKGWDFRATYSREFDLGDISVNLSYSTPDLTYTQSTPAAAPTSTFGHQPDRFSGSAFWGRGAWDAGVTVNYQSRYYISGVTSPNSAYPSYIEWNPQVSYNFGRDPNFGVSGSAWYQRWLADSKLTVTVVNVFEKEPTILDAANNRFAGDPRLRRYIMTLTKKF
jgi:iron complex outermembrane receptor protein